MLKLNEQYICPYCGSINILSKYMTSNKQGYITKKVICPDCKESIKLNTLVSQITPYQWGEWLYLNIRFFNGVHFRFYDKIHFDKLVENMKFLGDYITNDFWNGYKYAKTLYYNNILSARNELESIAKIIDSTGDQNYRKEKLDKWLKEGSDPLW